LASEFEDRSVKLVEFSLDINHINQGYITAEGFPSMRFNLSGATLQVEEFPQHRIERIKENWCFLISNAHVCIWPIDGKEYAEWLPNRLIPDFVKKRCWK